jgi:DNA invertase Pin-like site-specific DNA recombinase
MSLVGYIRVSTVGQKLEVQQDAMKAAHVDRVFADKISGTSMAGRKALNDCLGYMRKGDTLVITKMDRLARSARDLYNIVHDLEKKGISIRVLDQGVDTSTVAGKAFMGMLATFAEFETNIRKERQLEGITKAKKKGVYKGRKATAQALKPKMLELLKDGMSKPQIAKEVGVSVASVYNVLKSC